MKHLISFNESYSSDSIEILRRFADRFESGVVGPDGNPIEPYGNEFTEFYHELRNDGIDGLEIQEVLREKIPKRS